MARGRGSRERTLAILAAIPDKIRAELRPQIEAEAAALVETMKRRVRKKSGALARATRWIMGDTALASSGILSAGGAGRSKGSKHGGSAGGIVRGDPDLTATIVSGDAEAFYARWVEFGTAPHTIAPKNSQGALFINGRWLAPGEAVQHPGAAAHPYFYPTFRARKKAIKRKLARAIGKAVQKAAAS